MKSVFCIICLSLIISCKGGDSGGSSSTSSPFVGYVYNQGLQDQGNGDLLLYGLKLEGSVVNWVVLFAPLGNLTTVYYTKRSGTFTYTGDEYRFNWDYETCSPSGYDEYTITGSDPKDRIYLTQNGTSVVMINELAGTPNIDQNQIVNLVEDVNCNQMP